MNQFGRVASYLSSLIGVCTVQSESQSALCTVHTPIGLDKYRATRPN